MSYLLLMQADFRIMCENAMIYNKPETIYHKAARKLLHSGMKILSQVWNSRVFEDCPVCSRLLTMNIIIMKIHLQYEKAF